MPFGKIWNAVKAQYKLFPEKHDVLDKSSSLAMQVK